MTNEPSPIRPTPAAPGVTDYRQRADEFERTAQRYSQHTGKLVVARGLTFLAAAACFLLAFLDPNARPVLIAAGTLMLLVFLTVAIVDDWLKRQCDHYQQLQQVNLWQQARLDRQWNAFPVPQVDIPSRCAAVAKDLDLFGHASLFQLLCLAKTPRGIAMLRDWLLEPAERTEIMERQQSVRELAAELELREELVLRGHMLAQGLAGPEAFIRWAESQPLLERHPWMKWFSRLVPAVGLLALIALVASWLPANVGATLLIVVLLLNVLFSVLFTGRVHDIFDNISTRNGELRHYLALFELFDSIPARTQRLADLRRTVVKEDGGTLRHLQRLNWIMKLAAVRHDPLLSVLYFAFQATMLWDFHALWILQRWQRRCGHHVRSWFDALAELEALFSLAGLANDHPAWGYPEITPEVGGQVIAQGIGHPLLSNAVRVSNDVTVGPAGTVLLVTGSNMSGKSTLLRSIGLNCLLAEAGGPVCAAAMQLPPLTVTTSMRIQDSLEDGVSFFMAELKRLKAIVDQATQYRQHGSRTLLFLLDEILQGTNSVERHLAVARVLAHLVEEGAIGAVSTHDLELAESPELATCCQAVHFRETLHGRDAAQQMTFDYLLRPGIATTKNAMKLLELVGLVAPQDPAGSSE